MKKAISKKDIAIIGVSGKFPKSKNLNEFWKNLKKGEELVSFYSIEELKELGVPPEVYEAPNFVSVVSSIDQPESFDYSFFGYTKHEAALMDPQTRIIHEQTWIALEDAGYKPKSIKGKTGVFFAAGDNINWRIHAAMNDNENVLPFYRDFISNKNSISTLVSYNFNLQGPSLYFESACSSSLVSVHQACRSLLMRECSMAVAGGIRVLSTKEHGYHHQENMIFSKDGHCRAFDEKSSGTLTGEGAGVVILKRLEDALNDKDNIYAVIKSSSVNNDGNRKVGFTAPSVEGQSECIKKAHQIANVSYDSIDYIETHGTGTILGDPIEIEALNKAFNYDTSYKCAIGSVKTNMGHLDAAAGVAGLIKATLAIQTKTIPPSLHYNKPNPNINFDSGPFFVNSELTKWTKKDKPMRAGVSSFGIGGTNAHLILEEGPDQEIIKTAERPYQLLGFSAKTSKSAQKYQNKLFDFLKENEEVDLSNLAYTLLTGREDFNHKGFFVSDKNSDVRTQIEELGSESLISSKLNKKSKVVFMFPGSGSQYINMGKDLYTHEPYFKKILNEGFSFLEKMMGIDFSKIMFECEEKEWNAQINNNQYTQPIVFIFEYALAMLLIKWGIKPNCMIGHSTGEYVAACLSGVFSYESGLSLVVKRAELMSKSPEGGMLAVALSESEITKLLHTDLSLAAVNSPEYCVVSGGKESIENLYKDLENKDVDSTKLRVSLAGHSCLMDSILDEFKETLEGVEISNPKIPFVSNLTGKEITNTEATSTKYWVEHLRKTVRFSEGISSLIEKADTMFIEIGSSNTLTTIFKQHKIDDSLNCNAINLIRHPNEEVNDQKLIVEKLGELWLNGVNIDWESYYEEESVFKISAPSYSFEEMLLPARVNPFEQLNNENFVFSKKGNKIQNSFYVPNWKRSIASIQSNKNKQQLTYLVFAEKGNVISSLIDELRQQGDRVIKIQKGESFQQIDENNYIINPLNDQDFLELFAKIKNNKFDVQQVVYGWSSFGKDQLDVIPSSTAALNLCKSIINNELGINKVTMLSQNNQLVLGDENSNVNANVVSEIIHTLLAKSKAIFSCSIDFDEKISAKISKIREELENNMQVTNVAYRNNYRWVRFFENMNLENTKKSSPIRNNKTYLITGGLGEIGTVLTKHLCDVYNANVVLIGRSKLPLEESWPNYLIDTKKDTGVYDKVQKISALKNMCKNVHYYQGDLTQLDTITKIVKEIEIEHGEISGIIHAAGTFESIEDNFIKQVSDTTVSQKSVPRLEAILNLYSVFKNKDIDFVWIPSSKYSLISNDFTLGIHEGVNKFIETFIESKREEPTNWLSVNVDLLSGKKIDTNDFVEIFENSFQIENSCCSTVSYRDLNFPIMEEDLAIVEEENTIERPVLKTKYVVASNETESQLVSLWKEIFNIEEIGVLDSFFALGGDSLKAMSFLKKIKKIYDIQINIKDFYKMATIKEVAEEINIAIKVNAVLKNSNKKVSVKI